VRFDVITLFPSLFDSVLDFGITSRAMDQGLFKFQAWNPRDFATDAYKTVDDRPFGGGEGMVLKPEPLFEAVEKLLGQPMGSASEQAALPEGTAIVLLSAAGKLFTQETARAFARLNRIILLCGRYEGVDERVAQHLATDEISVGDYVLSGGELPAAIVLDAVTRLLPGALGNEASTENESFSPDSDVQGSVARHSPLATRHCLLDFPHYTRPADFRGWKVPEVLIGGHHAEVARWRKQQAELKTRRNRPDLFREIG